MAEYGEWNRKGATLSDVTAAREYGVSRAFIAKGIRAGKLEYREGAIWGNPYLRVLRSQLEQCIAEEFGGDRLASEKNRTQLQETKREMVNLRKRLAQLEAQKIDMENALRKRPPNVRLQPMRRAGYGRSRARAAREHHVDIPPSRPAGERHAAGGARARHGLQR